MDRYPNRGAQQSPPPAKQDTRRAILIGVGAAIVVIAVFAIGFALASSRGGNQSPVVITATPQPTTAAAAASPTVAPRATTQAPAATTAPAATPTAAAAATATPAPTATAAAINLAGSVSEQIPGTPIELGKTYSSIIEPRQSQVFSVTLQVGQTVHVQITPGTLVQLYPVDAKNLGFDVGRSKDLCDNSASTKPCNGMALIGTSGTYPIRVVSFFTETTKYTITLSVT